MRKLWKEGATGGDLKFLEDTSVGRRLLVARAPRAEEAGKDEVSEGEEGGPSPAGPP